MKNNWVFKLERNLWFNRDKKETISLNQKRNFRGEEGDGALILEFLNGNWQFTAHYEIQSIKIENPDAEKKIINIGLALVSLLEDKLLDDYIYSLRRVTDFKRPIKHFRRKYNRLSVPEFDGILEDNIYQKRTIVGTILNALHRSHQESFLVYLAEKSPEQLLANADMDEVFTVLLEYLNYAVIKPALYLAESVRILRTLKIDTKDIGFGFDIETVSNSTLR